MFLAVCGCWGALRYNRCCLGMYFTFLLFVFAAEVATGIAGVVFKDEVLVSYFSALMHLLNLKLCLSLNLSEILEGTLHLTVSLFM